MPPKVIRYLKDEYPELFAEIDIDATLAEFPDLDLDKLGMGSTRKIYWRCGKHPEYPFKSAPNSRTAHKHNCSICAGRQIVRNYNSFAHLHPVLASEQHPNSTVDLFAYASSSNVKSEWLCGECGHSWIAPLGDRAKGRGCIKCGHKRSGVASATPKEGMSLAEVNPQLAQEWHPTKNTLSPTEVSCSSGKSVWWKCINKNHEWQATINNRTRGDGCAKCKKHGTSKIEARFRERLQAEESLLVFPFAPFKPNYTFGGYPLTFDIFFQAGEGYRDKYVVEYDGYYHNKDKARERDIRKTNALLARGFKVIRIRENNLTHLDNEHENLLQLTYQYSTSPESLDPIIGQILDWA